MSCPSLFPNIKIGEETPMESFFAIWSPQGGNPIVKQPTLEAAAMEAERLALKNPGKEFFVMVAVAQTKIKGVEIEWVNDRIVQIPERYL